jgi:hypothetical protein
MFCPDCDTNLDFVEVGDLCPRCGGFRRSANAAAATARVVVSAGEVSLKIIRGDHRPWTEKWLTVLQCLEALRALGSGDVRRLGNAQIDNRALMFFVECDHLRDWLEWDVLALGGAVTADIKNHFQSSQPLVVCNAICNSHKHHTRRSGITARIRETLITPDGAKIYIEVDWATAGATRIDAVVLADQCVSSWRSFFSTSNITEP